MDDTKIVPTLADNGRPSAGPTLPSTGGTNRPALRRGAWSLGSGALSSGALQPEKGLLSSWARLQASLFQPHVTPLSPLKVCPLSHIPGPQGTHKAPLENSVDFSAMAQALGQTEGAPLFWAGVPLALSEAGQSDSLWVLGPFLPSPQPLEQAWGRGGRGALRGCECTPFSHSHGFSQPAQHAGGWDTERNMIVSQSPVHPRPSPGPQAVTRMLVVTAQPSSGSVDRGLRIGFMTPCLHSAGHSAHCDGP